MITIHAHLIIYIVISPNIFRLLLRHHQGDKYRKYTCLHISVYSYIREQYKYVIQLDVCMTWQCEMWVIFVSSW